MLYEEWFTKWLENNQEFYAAIDLNVLQRMALSNVYRAAFEKEVANQPLDSDRESNGVLK